MKGKRHLLSIFYRKTALLLALTGEDLPGLRKNGGDFVVKKGKVPHLANSTGNLAIFLPLYVEIFQKCEKMAGTLRLENKKFPNSQTPRETWQSFCPYMWRSYRLTIFPMENCQINLPHVGTF